MRIVAINAEVLTKLIELSSEVSGPGLNFKILKEMIGPAEIALENKNFDVDASDAYSKLAELEFENLEAQKSPEKPSLVPKSKKLD